MGQVRSTFDDYFERVPFGIEVADQLQSRTLTADQVDALRDYTESAALNLAIRSGRVSAAVRRWIEVIDSAMRLTPVSLRATRVVNARDTYRSMGVNSPIDVGSLVGAMITEHGYTSVSLLGVPPADIVRSVPADQRLVLELVVPAGSLAVYLEHLSAHRGEQELLVARGVRYRIMSEPVPVSRELGRRVRAIIRTKR